jgi:molecular chaperone DnaJ
MKNKCNTCYGNGVVRKEEVVDIEIPKGAYDGTYMTMPQYGNEIKNGIAGDLQIVVTEIEDIQFKRQESDLIYNVHINVIDAILGIDKKLKLPHGDEIKYTISQGSTHGKILRIKGKGVPNVHFPGHQGDLLIKVNLDVPSEITIEERLKLEEVKKMRNFK